MQFVVVTVTMSMTYCILSEHNIYWRKTYLVENRLLFVESRREINGIHVIKTKQKTQVDASRFYSVTFVRSVKRSN